MAATFGCQETPRIVVDGFNQALFRTSTAIEVGSKRLIPELIWGAFSSDKRGFRLIAPHYTACYAENMNTCDKCQGTMLYERAVDLNAGLVITVLACLNCGRRRPVEQQPRPITARC
mgnify:CR=1 FL=1|jgi:hypothetical protein